ncbi:MAG: RNA-binding transcriptional accessory protein, partial [Clostridia bacterium]|nr:RNA-binding transcriptional accessory protein [Clostridia bacterium]
MDFVAQLSAQFSIKPEYVKNILTLIDDGNTIPFIARYRKEMHGTQNDQTIRELADRYEYLQGLEKRREEVRTSIENLGVMTDEISAALGAAATLAEIEDIYRPYKPKRKTRASVAREKGLEPLADAIFAQEKGGAFPIDMAEGYIDPEKGVETAQDALQGALDIIAENISDNASIRKRLRYVAFANGKLRTKAADPEADSVYTLYYDYSEPLNKIAGHRVLAVDRGEREGFLKVSVDFDKAKGLNIVFSESVVQGSNCTDAVIEAATDAYDRLIFPSIERELRSDLTANAAEGAIKNFSQNLRQLLMQPPVKSKTVIGLDPGYRTGC